MYYACILYLDDKNIKGYIDYLRSFCEDVFVGYKNEKPDIENAVELDSLSFDMLYEKLKAFKEDDIILFIKDNEIIPKDAFEEAEFEDILPLKLKCINEYVNHICKNKYKTGPFLCKGYIKESKDNLYETFEKNPPDYLYESGYFITKCKDYICIEPEELDISIDGLIKRCVKIFFIDAHVENILNGAQKVSYEFAKMFQDSYKLHYFVESEVIYDKLSELNIELSYFPVEEEKFSEIKDDLMNELLKSISYSNADLYIENGPVFISVNRPVIYYMNAHLGFVKQHNSFAGETIDWIKHDKIFVVTVAGHISEYLIKEEGIEEYRVFTIPNWVEHIEEKPKAYNKDKFRVGWVSRFLPEKGWMDLVEALKDTDIEAHFLGDGSDLEIAKSLKQEQNLKNMHFLGWVDNPQSYLKDNVEIFVFTSHAYYEAFSLSMLEAMATGIPLISYDMPSNRYVLGDEGLFYKNIDELRELIFRLKQDEEFYNKMASYSLERAKMFTKEKAKQRWQEVIEKVLQLYKEQ